MAMFHRCDRCQCEIEDGEAGNLAQEIVKFKTRNQKGKWEPEFFEIEVQGPCDLCKRCLIDVIQGKQEITNPFKPAPTHIETFEE